jgi:rare lipoprotein A
MVVRLSAALCSVAMMLLCSAAVTAKSSTTPISAGPSKKTASRKSALTAAPVRVIRKATLDANGNESKGRVFAAGIGSFLCEVKPVTFAERFRAAQMVIGRSKLQQTNSSEMAVTILGTASMYNPYRPGYQEGGIETASGELYDPAAWTAAVQTGLRETFGGVRHGKDYRPTYALLESGDKQVIVKINDVGPLKPGRVIDLNQQTMYYFDPSLQHGLVFGMMITPLPGDGWVAGPVERPLHRNVMDVVLANKLARMAWNIHTAFLAQSAD